MKTLLLSPRSQISSSAVESEGGKKKAKIAETFLEINRLHGKSTFAKLFFSMNTKTQINQATTELVPKIRINVRAATKTNRHSDSKTNHEIKLERRLVEPLGNDDDWNMTFSRVYHDRCKILCHLLTNCIFHIAYLKRINP
ncbi:hypothetical protein PoB_000661300 [Plakobranchus ocellatus]|uniref:Uncharacterized protein n=1 Tax=Plakobranchus ocellatus TaxID=259542 RepID=A0AAV3YD74_9GAST|nr:hypothetical protein PoB_000661300 [Plakobranchus ocellatus]